MQRVAWVLLDVDGVLTDGGLPYGPEGNLWKVFHSRDGFALRAAIQAGLGVGLVSGRASQGVERRARELGLDPLFLGVGEKVPVVEAWRASQGLDWSQLAYMGDDVPDVGLLARVGCALVPADAPWWLKQRAHYVASYPGGHGAVADCLERLLRAQGLWGGVVDGHG